MYSKLDEEAKQQVDQARNKEWEDYVRFDAIKIIDEQEAQRYIDEGIEVLPMQWVDVNKHEGLLDPNKRPLPPSSNLD